MTEILTGLGETNPRTLHLCYYHGRSLISWAIKCFTWGDISHVAVRDPELEVVWEAWQGGVRRVASISDNHKERTQVDVYAVDMTEKQYVTATAFLDAQVGKPYDYFGVCSFALRCNMGSKKRWFCSELAMAAFNKAGIPLLRCPPFKATPTMLSYSPMQRFVCKEYTKRG